MCVYTTYCSFCARSPLSNCSLDSTALSHTGNLSFPFSRLHIRSPMQTKEGKRVPFNQKTWALGLPCTNMRKWEHLQLGFLSAKDIRSSLGHCQMLLLLHGHWDGRSNTISIRTCNSTFPSFCTWIFHNLNSHCSCFYTLNASAWNSRDYPVHPGHALSPSWSHIHTGACGTWRKGWRAAPPFPCWIPDCIMNSIILIIPDTESLSKSALLLVRGLQQSLNGPGRLKSCLLLLLLLKFQCPEFDVMSSVWKGQGYWISLELVGDCDLEEFSLICKRSTTSQFFIWFGEHNFPMSSQTLLLSEILIANNRAEELTWDLCKSDPRWASKWLKYSCTHSHQIPFLSPQNKTVTHFLIAKW